MKRVLPKAFWIAKNRAAREILFRATFVLPATHKTHSLERGATSTTTTAALSIAFFIAVLGMQVGNYFRADAVVLAPREPVNAPSYMATSDTDQNGTPDWRDELVRSGLIATSSATTSPDTEENSFTLAMENTVGALYSGYLSLKQQGIYSSETSAKLGREVAAGMTIPTTFTPYDVHDLRISDDTSIEGVLRYRSTMRDALAPLITDDAPEFELFARFVQTKDRAWLGEIAAAAARYSDAETKMLTVLVPKDATPEHLRALNALGTYARTLEMMSRVAVDDSFAALTILKTQNNDEEQLLRSFDVLAQYYVRKVTN